MFATAFIRVLISQQRSLPHSIGLLLVVLAVVTWAGASIAQPIASSSPVSIAPAPVLVAPVSGPQWSELTQAQRAILQPLASEWERLDPARKRKWIVVAQTYPQKTPIEQEKLQARMAEWASLSPRERAVARLNYAATKKLPEASNRSAEWDAYQALSPEEKQKFAAKAAGKVPKGAALAPKVSLANKVTPVPITRHTSTAQRAAASAQVPILDRKTLLPLAPKPVIRASAPIAAPIPTPTPAPESAPAG